MDPLRVLELKGLEGRDRALVSNAAKFREYADECRRLAVRVRDPELKAIANELMAAWIALADSAGSPNVVLADIGQNSVKDEPLTLL